MAWGLALCEWCRHPILVAHIINPWFDFIVFHWTTAAIRVCSLISMSSPNHRISFWTLLVLSCLVPHLTSSCLSCQRIWNAQVRRYKMPGFLSCLCPNSKPQSKDMPELRKGRVYSAGQEPQPTSTVAEGGDGEQWISDLLLIGAREGWGIGAQDWQT